MGTITGQELADNAAGLVNDTGRVRWTDADWLVWLNDGHREAANKKNDVYVTTSATLVTPSSTRQELPADGLQLMSVVRNMGADGLTPGRAIRIADREILDTHFPNWHNDAADAVNGVTNYMFDPRDPYHYYVYPQAPATAWYVEVVYGAIPPDMASLGDTILLRDTYGNALLDYMLYRAYSRDRVYGEVNQAGAEYYTSFLSGLGLKQQEESQNNPNLTTTGFDSSTDATAAKPAG